MVFLIHNNKTLKIKVFSVVVFRFGFFNLFFICYGCLCVLFGLLFVGGGGFCSFVFF